MTIQQLYDIIKNIEDKDAQVVFTCEKSYGLIKDAQIDNNGELTL